MKKLIISSLSLLGMFLIIGIAYGMDLWLDNLKLVAMSQFKMTSWLLPATFAPLLIAGLLLLWLWFIYSQGDNHPVVAIVYIVVGVSLLFYNFVIITANTQLPMLNALTPKSMTSFVCAMASVVGLHRLIFKNFSI